VSDYTPRVIDTWLDDLQPHLPAVSVYGPKGVGKTATARRRATSVLKLDDELDLERVRADPSVLTSRAGTLLIDEWQRYPESWDRVRRAVDDGAGPGRFLLTGSSAPRGAIVHSGAGRIVGARMRPMSLPERGLAVPTVSLGGMLTGHAAVDGETDVVLEQYVEEIVSSGFPGIRNAPERARHTLLGAYVETVVQREFPEQGYPVRRPETLLGWLAAYAAAESSTAKYSEILDAATPAQGDKPAKTTTIAYRDALSALWLLDPTPAWMPAGSTLNRLSQAPKHHLADPALATHLLQLDVDALLAGALRADRPWGGSVLGALFESLVSLDVKVYAPNLEARVYHVRDRNGLHEVDLLVQGNGGRLVALEVKLSATVQDADVRHLLWLKDRLGDDLVDMAVVTTGRHAYRRRDGVAVVPAALLGP
jgi:predicted AAA+ superfamily ATPase